MEDLTPATKTYYAHLGRKQLQAFLEEALKAAELWYQHEVNEDERIKADDARSDIADLLEGLDD